MTEKKNYDKIFIYRRELFEITNFGFIETRKDFPEVCEAGDVLFCTADNKTYIYVDEGLGGKYGWEEYTSDPKAMVNLGLTEYEINKMIVAQLPSMIKDSQIQSSKELIKEFTHRHITSVGYYMLLCNDIRYYTVFEVCNEYEEKVEDIIIECLQNKGVIQQINYNENQSAIECWIKNEDGVFMFLLFDYEWGVITCQ